MKYKIDPEFVSDLEMLPIASSFDPVEMRQNDEALLAAMNANVDLSALDVIDKSIPGPVGAPAVTVRVYSPRPSKNRLRRRLCYISTAAVLSRAALIPNIVYRHYWRAS